MHVGADPDDQQQWITVAAEALIRDVDAVVAGGAVFRDYPSTKTDAAM
ncbi:MAG: hypothetical protein JWR32_4459 [Mycobacterium sp.]|jgi:hypothetical protein|nr:hypothetical protein [Mycobacterium sp.]